MTDGSHKEKLRTVDTEVELTRPAFETWVIDNLLWNRALERNGDMYRLVVIENNWNVWKAAIASQLNGPL